MSSTQTVTHGKLQPSRTHDYLYGEKFSNFFRKSVTWLSYKRQKEVVHSFLYSMTKLSTNTQTNLLHFTLILVFILSKKWKVLKSKFLEPSVWNPKLKNPNFYKIEQNGYGVLFFYHYSKFPLTLRFREVRIIYINWWFTQSMTKKILFSFRSSVFIVK